MSFNTSAVNPSGHVPVGTGQQVPARPARRQPPVTVPLGHQGATAVTVYREGEPARQVPAAARRAMQSRARHYHPTGTVHVHALHQTEEVRQVPGTNAAVVTKKGY